ncbi:phage portal protein [Nocardia rhizosphaerae]|uniref:Phage portal protein n=1 Tax=Nocardia rhizosphaerae TaxID=1691571 RepID=A0ABV8L9K6_9NOCA
MGIISSLRAVRALPDLVAASTPYAPQHVQVESPWTAYPSHLNQVVWPDLVGLENVLPMTRLEAMTVPAVARARKIICGAIAGMPLHVLRGDDILAPQPAWLDRTDGEVSPYHRMLWTVDDLLFWGWSLWRVTRGADGSVLAAGRVPWDRWDFDTFGRVEIDGELVADSAVCLIPGVDEGILWNGKLAIRHAARLLAAADKAAATPAAHLELHQTNEAPMTAGDRADLIAAWVAARRGENGGVAMTPSSIEVRELGAASEHLLLEGRNAAAIDIARTMGVPASALDASLENASMTYSTTESRNAELVDYGLAPYMSAISARLGMDDMVPRGQRVAFDAENFVGVGARSVAPPDDGGPAPAQAAAPAAPATPRAGAATPQTQEAAQ